MRSCDILATRVFHFVGWSREVTVVALSSRQLIDCLLVRCASPLPALLQGVVQPVTAVSCLTLGLAPLFNWLLIFKLGGGIDGAVMAMVACNAVMLALLTAFVAWHERQRLGTPKQTWHGW